MARSGSGSDRGRDRVSVAPRRRPGQSNQENSEMAKCTIEFAFAIRDEVIIRASGMVGKVVALWQEQAMLPQYRVLYADRNGEMKDAFCFADDMRAADALEVAGTPGNPIDGNPIRDGKPETVK